MADDVRETLMTPGLIRDTVKIIESQNYISHLTLLRKMHEKYGDFDEQDLWQDIQALSKKSNAPIGVVSEEEAGRAILSPKVVYSTSWVEKNKTSSVYLTAEVIGLDLYRKIVCEGWNGYKGQYLDYNVLTESGYDYVIGYDWECKQYRWKEFQAKYVMSAMTSMPESSSNLGEKSYRNGMAELKMLDENVFLRGKAREDCYKYAIDYLMEASRVGHPLAKFQLGKMCENQNPERSRVFYKEAKPGLEQMAAAGSDEAKNYFEEIQSSELRLV